FYASSYSLAQTLAPGFAVILANSVGGGGNPNDPPIQSSPWVSANDVFVVGNRAYVATQDDKMGIIDISIPTNPAYMGYIAHGTDNAYLSNAKALHVQGNYAYVVSNGTSALEIIDITNSLLPAHVGTMLDAGNQMTFPED